MENQQYTNHPRVKLMKEMYIPDPAVEDDPKTWQEYWQRMLQDKQWPSQYFVQATAWSLSHDLWIMDTSCRKDFPYMTKFDKSKKNYFFKNYIYNQKEKPEGDISLVTKIVGNYIKRSGSTCEDILQKNGLKTFIKKFVGPPLGKCQFEFSRLFENYTKMSQRLTTELKKLKKYPMTNYIIGVLILKMMKVN